MWEGKSNTTNKSSSSVVVVYVQWLINLKCEWLRTLGFVLKNTMKHKIIGFYFKRELSIDEISLPIQLSRCYAIEINNNNKTSLK